MFYSILFEAEANFRGKINNGEPAFFKDLDISEVVEAVLRGRRDYELENFFYTMLSAPEEVTYRQETMREFEDPEVRKVFEAFSKETGLIKREAENARRLMTETGRRSNTNLSRGRLFAAAEKYAVSVSRLLSGIHDMKLTSRGLVSFREYLEDYTASSGFTKLDTEVRELRASFDALEYCMLVKDDAIRVRKYEGQADHSEKLISLFDKFREGDVADYRQDLLDEQLADHVEDSLLDILSRYYPKEFSALNEFVRKQSYFYDETIIRFAREIQFFFAWLDYIAPMKKAGLSFCFPTPVKEKREQYAFGFFDLALAKKILEKTVTNDFTLTVPEQILVITGPNQGGKTTFARAFGQIHYFMSLGLSVPGTKGKLYLPDTILTHFEREEDLTAMSGKLKDDLMRLKKLVKKAEKSDPIIIVNEIFASTTLKDAVTLGNFMMDHFVRLKAPSLVVTFIDELASHGPETVSMMSTVSSEVTEERNFRILRKPADGLAYALKLASDHALTYEQLKRRLRG